MDNLFESDGANNPEIIRSRPETRCDMAKRAIGNTIPTAEVTALLPTEFADILEELSGEMLLTEKTRGFLRNCFPEEGELVDNTTPEEGLGALLSIWGEIISDSSKSANSRRSREASVRNLREVLWSFTPLSPDEVADRLGFSQKRYSNKARWTISSNIVEKRYSLAETLSTEPATGSLSQRRISFSEKAPPRIMTGSQQKLVELVFGQLPQEADLPRRIELIERAIEGGVLSDRSKKVINRRFLGDTPKTQKATGEELGTTRTPVVKAEKRAIKALRRYILPHTDVQLSVASWRTVSSNGDRQSKQTPKSEASPDKDITQEIVPSKSTPKIDRRAAIQLFKSFYNTPDQLLALMEMNDEGLGDITESLLLLFKRRSDGTASIGKDVELASERIWAKLSGLHDDDIADGNTTRHAIVMHRKAIIKKIGDDPEDLKNIFHSAGQSGLGHKNIATGEMLIGASMDRLKSDLGRKITFSPTSSRQILQEIFSTEEVLHLSDREVEKIFAQTLDVFQLLVGRDVHLNRQLDRVVMMASDYKLDYTAKDQARPSYRSYISVVKRSSISLVQLRERIALHDAIAEAKPLTPNPPRVVTKRTPKPRQARSGRGAKKATVKPTASLRREDWSEASDEKALNALKITPSIFYRRCLDEASMIIIKTFTPEQMESFTTVVKNLLIGTVPDANREQMRRAVFEFAILGTGTINGYTATQIKNELETITKIAKRHSQILGRAVVLIQQGKKAFN